MYQESTKGYVAGMSFLELLAAAGVGGLIGYGAGSLVELVAISSMPFVAQMLASAGIGGIAGAGVGITAIGVVTNTDTIIKRKIDTVMAKNVTKCINAVIKTLAADSDTENKTISNLKKFKKASDKLAKELDYNTSKNHSYRGVLNKRELPENVKTAFDELKELAVKAATSVDIHANNKDFLKNYFKKMEAVLELMYDKDAIKSTFDDTKKTDAAINQESYAENSFMSIIQEAIDFGYPDETSEANKQNQPSDVPPAPDADPSAPTVNADPNANPDGGNVDNMEQPPVDDPNAAPPVEGEEKQPVDTNDVSDQIADKVSDETTNDNQDTGVDANGDISLDDSTETPDESATDTPEMDAGGFDNIDSSLDDLDNTTSSTDDTTMGDPANMDINSMSIDDIMAQAAEKLKSMPIDQVKQFLSDGVSSGLNTTPDLQTESYQQEAFFITKHNVKKELNAWIKKCLGDLNMSDKSLNEIIKAFKSSGKKLNRVLSKALKMNDIFNPEQMSHLNALNSALVKLQTGLQPTASAEETNVVKGLIRAFTDEAAIVGKFVSQ